MFRRKERKGRRREEDGLEQQEKVGNGTGKMESIRGGKITRPVHTGRELQGFFQVPTLPVEDFHGGRLRATDMSAHERLTSPRFS
jgi:hypothetical protein